MALQIASLNSGSNGNCYFIGNGEEAVLIDAGISCKETEIRLQRLGINIRTIKAIFISHEHSDHIKGVETLSSKYQLPVYITDHTHNNGRLNLKNDLKNNFTAHQPCCIGKLKITAFPKIHDAIDPHSFVVEDEQVKIGVFTDIGAVCSETIRYFRQCHAVFLEANYDEDMLRNGNYPYYLKKRISDGKGHLSNMQAVELFTKYRSRKLSHLFLSHLSKQNNCPILASDLFQRHAGSTQVIVASRERESTLFRIGKPVRTLKPFPASNQLNLFV